MIHKAKKQNSINDPKKGNCPNIEDMNNKLIIHISRSITNKQKQPLKKHVRFLPEAFYFPFHVSPTFFLPWLSVSVSPRPACSTHTHTHTHYLLIVAVGQDPVLLLGVKEQAEDVEAQAVSAVGRPLVGTNEQTALHLGVSQQHDLRRHETGPWGGNG